jgi:hypothetical protein
MSRFLHSDKQRRFLRSHSRPSTEPRQDCRLRKRFGFHASDALAAEQAGVLEHQRSIVLEYLIQHEPAPRLANEPRQKVSARCQRLLLLA